MQIFDLIIENFDKLNKFFQLDLTDTNKGWVGQCKCHDGDNPHSFILYKAGHKKWLCHTNRCDTKYGNHSVALIRILLEKKYNRGFSHHQAIEWCEAFFNTKADTNPKDFDDRLTSLIGKLNSEPAQSFKITEKQFLSRLKRPASYFLERDYKEETLDYFKLGYCNDPTKPMYSRVVVPHFNNDGKYIIACLGRIIYEKCEACQHYHNPKGICRVSPKWKNSINFPGSTSLFNYHRAFQYIKKTGTAILTESAPNTFRLYEAGFPMSVASFGAKFSESQRNLLDQCGTHTIILVPDAGNAGEQMVEQVRKECKFTHNIVIVEPNNYKDDIGECNVETVKKIIGPYIEKVI